MARRLRHAPQRAARAYCIASLVWVTLHFAGAVRLVHVLVEHSPCCHHADHARRHGLDGERQAHLRGPGPEPCRRALGHDCPLCKKLTSLKAPPPTAGGDALFLDQPAPDRVAARRSAFRSRVAEATRARAPPTC